MLLDKGVGGDKYLLNKMVIKWSLTSVSVKGGLPYGNTASSVSQFFLITKMITQLKIALVYL